MSSQQPLEHFVLYDSDANPISSHLADEGACTVTWLGEAMLYHLEACERATVENAKLGIEPADDPVTLQREMIGPDNEWYRGPVS